MNPTNSDMTVPAWMAQLTDPVAWQSWLAQMQKFQPNMANAASGIPGSSAGSDLSEVIDPTVLKQLQETYVGQMSHLWQDMLGDTVPAIADRRFTGPAWKGSKLYAFNAAAYLLNGQFLLAMADAAKVPPKKKQKIRFAVQQMVDAMSPANFLVTNPEAQKKLVETNGESLAKGVAHILADMKKGRITQTDESAFEVGKNVATTAGNVVFENALFQLIQYSPLTETVYQRPLLIVPPCINKYYILDLQPENSLVRYAAAQGHTVFLVSWRNADTSMETTTWDDYIEDGVITAIHTAQKITGQDQINALGFCVGGTILSNALAVLFARGEEPVSSLTLLTAFLDFSDTGVIDVFIDEDQVKSREESIGEKGLMPGPDFTTAFSSLRPNDLVWNYVRSNYLNGEDPQAFDLLYWNADCTNLPGPMFCWYLRNMYLEDNLKVAGKLTVAGQKVDLSIIQAPTFIYGSREDHIVPWTSAYQSTRLLNPKKSKNNRFVLGASGHIAGVINPPAKKKRSYWTNDQPAKNADAWLAGATEHPGSWWTEWSAFLAPLAGKQINAPKQAGNKEFKVIESAPGRYVKVRVDQMK